MALNFEWTDRVVPILNFELLNDLQVDIDFNAAVVTLKRDPAVKQFLKKVHEGAPLMIDG